MRILSQEDLKTGEFILQRERISPITHTSLFKGAIYCLLSATENYKKQLKVYNSLINRGYDTPPNILHNFDEVKKLIKKTRFPNQKESRILKFSVWWLHSGLHSDLSLKILENWVSDEFLFRNRLAKEVPGFGLKCASLFLNKCGYYNVIPIDIWILRFLKKQGYNVKIPDYRTISGIQDKEYYKMEKILIKIAKEHNITPALLQAALWGKFSSWNDSPFHPGQTSLDDFLEAINSD